MLGKKSQNNIETIVGNGTQISGELSTKGTIRIEGIVAGNIDADWVIVGESGSIRGNTRTRGIVVDGTVEGNIDADETIELSNKSRISGDLLTKKLSIAEGAMFDGQSRMKGEGGSISRNTDDDLPIITRITS